MTLTPEEARGILADIDGVARKMRNTLAASSLGPNLMIWGLVWAFGFTGTYFWPARSGTIWGSLLAAGGLASMAVGVRQYRARLVQSEADKRLGVKMLGLWLTIFTYATALLLIWKPTDGRDIVILFVCFAMMAYVIMGIWLASGPLAFAGLSITVATLIGRLWLPMDYFLIWMAVFGGGGLFIPGLYMYWRWR